jgi:hypothetical protein
MTHRVEPMDKLVELCAEGAKRFGDDPAAIATFVETEINRLPESEQHQLKYALSLLTDGGKTLRQ